MIKPKLQITDHRSQIGFTLMEALVATTVFAFVFVAIFGIYLTTIKLDRKSRAQRLLAQNSRFIMDFMAKEIRNGSINYGCPEWGGIVPANTDLCIKTVADDSDRIFYDPDTKDIKLSRNGGDATNLNSSKVNVDNLSFNIAPIGNPYDEYRGYNEQPRVTIILELSNQFGTNPADFTKVNIQSTFATRIYPSRE